MSQPPTVDDWRVYRPAIWLAMLGIAILLVFGAPIGYAGVLLLGAAIGVGLRIQTRRRRLVRSGGPRRSPRR